MTTCQYAVTITNGATKKIQFLDADVSTLNYEHLKLKIEVKIKHIIVTESALEIKEKIPINGLPVTLNGLAFECIKVKPIVLRTRQYNDKVNEKRLLVSAKPKSTITKSPLKEEFKGIKSSSSSTLGRTIAEIVKNQNQAKKRSSSESPAPEAKKRSSSEAPAPEAKKRSSSEAPAPAHTVDRERAQKKHLKRKLVDVEDGKNKKQAKTSDTAMDAFIYPISKRKVEFKATIKEQGASTPFDKHQSCPLVPCKGTFANFADTDKHMQYNDHLQRLMSCREQMPM